MRISIAGLFLFFCGLMQGEILNGGFEIPEPNQGLPFSPPMHWQRDDTYAGLHDSFVPIPEDRCCGRQFVNWIIENPYEGSLFVVLSTGDYGKDEDIIKSSIRQRVTFESGDRFSGAFFFGTCDYEPYYDIGMITLEHVSNDPNLDLFVAGCSLEEVGMYGSTGDWVPFVYYFTDETAGTYDIVCSVEDVGDKIYKSYFAVDDLKVCRSLYEYGDIDMDCAVNMTDMTIMSSAWMSFCPDPNVIYEYPDLYPYDLYPELYDPNFYPDPNCPCEIADINKDYYVDSNDLLILTDYWLENGF